MPKQTRFTASYDRKVDTLYISTQEAAERGVAEGACIWRYDEAGHLVGVTIMDFHEIWQAGSDTLSKEVAERLELPLQLARALLETGTVVPSTH